MHRGPGCEWQPGWADGDASVIRQLERCVEIGGGMAFVEDVEQLVVDRFERGDDEGDAKVSHLRQERLMLNQVFDLDRGVECQAWMVAARFHAAVAWPSRAR